MRVSKVVYGNDTVIDLTGDTITADRLCAGYTAHGADGEAITGTLNTASLECKTLRCGWVGRGNGIWTYENPTDALADMYHVVAGHEYWLTLGANVGTRFRVMFTTVDVSSLTSGTVTGTAVNTKNFDNPASFLNLLYTPSADGYIIVQKDNVGNTDIKTYLYDKTASLQ